jgi:uncharacterized protein
VRLCALDQFLTRRFLKRSALAKFAFRSTLTELEQVLQRDKFDRYLNAETRQAFVALVRQYAHLFAVAQADELNVQPACRDTEANKFLALALGGEADAIVSSDQDLLALNPWRAIPVLTPAGFIQSGPDDARSGERIW